MEKVYANDPRFWGATDDETVQNAVDYAKKLDLGAVTIPRCNDRTGQMRWIFHQAVLLPSDMRVYLDGCCISHADDTEDNLFRNKNCWVAPDDAQENIRIIGLGNARLEGGSHNGSSEQRFRSDPQKYKCMEWNCAVLFSNVTNFEVRDLRFVQTRYWAVCFHYCSWGYIGRLHFESHGIYENQDGIDLRLGCSYITVENITGITGDDTLALTALPATTAARRLRPAGSSPDIHDITIRNITASTHGCGVLRFLCEGGARIYNVTAEDIKDTTGSISGTAVIIGTPDVQFCDEKRKMGDLKNIVIRNVTTCAQRGITLAEGCRDMVIENVFTYGPNEVGLRFMGNFSCDNLVIRNVTIRSQAETLDCAISMPFDEFRLLKDLRIQNLTVGTANYVFRGTQLDVDGIQAEEPKMGWFTPEVPPLKSAYSRYHNQFWGEAFPDRPTDNRFDGTLKTQEEMARE